MEHTNLILDTDSYKASHYLQYPPGTTRLVAYLESRGGMYPYTVFFGLQYILKKYLTQRVYLDDVREAENFFKNHGLPFNTAGWTYIAKNLKGRIPLRIYAVQEGSVIPTHNILMRVESTDSRVPWITTWFETMLMRVWYPTTVATRSHVIKRLIYSFLEDTSDDPREEILFKLHDFGSRGVSSSETAAIGGAAHLVNFKGSDTVVGVTCANTYYHSKMAAFSIPAAEHSTIISWEKNKEEQAYHNILTQFASTGKIVAVVSDSYDIWYAINQLWGKRLREQVVKSGATIVIRSDSGHPPSVVPKIIEKLANIFGTKKNKKGYDVLNYVRVIQGDAVTYDAIHAILQRLKQKKLSATNIAFGMGGALLQQVNRDTQQFAYKVCLATINGKEIPVAKNPKTDSTKQSKSGYLDLIKTTSGYKTVLGPRKESLLKLVFENGRMRKQYNFEEVRKNAELQ